MAPGLYKRERRAFLPFLAGLADRCCSLMGAALVYYIILPFVAVVLALPADRRRARISVELLPKVSDYLSLVTTLLLAFGLCFQLPVVLTLLRPGRHRVDSAHARRDGATPSWRCSWSPPIVTPPDPISQTMLALPIILLYEISIICVKLIERTRRREEEAANRDIVPVRRVSRRLGCWRVSARGPPQALATAGASSPGW